MSEITLHEAHKYLWEFSKLALPGSEGDFEEGMYLPKSIIDGALKRLRFKLAQKRIALHTIEETEKLLREHKRRVVMWEDK